MEENSGVEAPVENKDIEEYIKLVVKEKEKMLKENIHTPNENDKDTSK